jgi:hypothetical protein
VKYLCTRTFFFANIKLKKEVSSNTLEEKDRVSCIFPFALQNSEFFFSSSIRG